MKPHKWAKEIKAWADGAEIETKYGEHDWETEYYPNWHSDEVKYRTKVETGGCKACVTCGQLVDQPQPKEPQYLYVYFNKLHYDVEFVTQEYKPSPPTFLNYVGKIKLETDDDTRS